LYREALCPELKSTRGGEMGESIEGSEVLAATRKPVYKIKQFVSTAGQNHAKITNELND